MKIIGKWKIIDILKNNNGHIIYYVSPIIDKNTTKQEFDDLVDIKWIMKYSIQDNSNEINIINEMKLYENELCIRMPISEKYRYEINHEEKYSWYITERYENSIYNSPKFCKNNLKLLGHYMINFFEWLHLEKQKIHGDIKPENIVVNSSKKIQENYFKIIDYDTISFPDFDVTCEESSFNGYYYYHLGCNSNESYLSFKMDLQAFGMILLNLCMSNGKYNLLEWQCKASQLYKDKYSVSQTNQYKYLNIIRKSSFTNVLSFIENEEHKQLISKYFSIIHKQGWNKNPNPIVYTELKELFKLPEKSSKIKIRRKSI